jgi:hypothetical protein
MVKNAWKWMLGVGTAVLLVGCGGGGGGETATSGGNGGLVDRSIPTVKLGSKAEVQIVFLSGQGRRDEESQVAVFNRLQFQNDENDFAPSLDQLPLPEVKVQLDGYTLNSRTFSVDMPFGESVRIFSEMPFEIERIEDSNGNTLTSGSPAFLTEIPFNADVICYAGRQSTVSLSVNDAIVRFDGTDGVIFDPVQFEKENYDQRGEPPSIRSFFSDYVGFDISGLARRPNMLNSSGVPNGPLVSTVLFSGDGIAIASGFDAPDTLQLLDPVKVENGVIRRPVLIGGDPAPGTYVFEEIDPRDESNVARIPSLSGIWRPYTEVLGNLGTFFAVSFPSSRFDDEQQLLMVSRSGIADNSPITAMWQGVVRYNSRLTGGTFSVWPIDQIDDGDPRNEVTGSISGIVFKAGTTTPASATFTVTGGGGNFPFPATGRYVVFLK